MTKEIENSWNDFTQALSVSEDDSILKQLKFPLESLLEKQANIDQAKKNLFKKEIGQLLRLYLSRVSIQELAVKMETHEKIFKRAFGPDKFLHLKLLIKLKTILEDKKPKKGLLAG